MYWRLLPLGGTVVMALSVTSCDKPQGGQSIPPLPVIATEVVVRDQPIYADFIGETHGSADVEIRARVEGFLEAVHFSEGMMVASNALLYTIDDRPFRAALEQAKGAQAQALALQEKAGRDANRLRPLWEKNAISRQQYDDAIAAERNAAAALQSARAAVDSAEIQLGYTKIHSPIEGLVGKTEVKPGNLVGRGTSTLLTTVSEVNPISVRFSISEKEYLAWKRRRGSDDERSRNASEDLFELILADGTYHNYRGRVSFADRQVDPKTGTLLLQVNFPNPDRLVRPGQFGRVRFAVETVTNAVLVPQRAVSELQATYSVFVVSADRKAEFRKVSPGARVGTFYVIQEGLQPGENIVIEGIQKLSNNALVTPAYTNLAAALPPLNPHHP
jgi:membrane fusion protein (multidrug efflux system)